jgi:hypothetical protein
MAASPHGIAWFFGRDRESKSVILKNIAELIPTFVVRTLLMLVLMLMLMLVLVEVLMLVLVEVLMLVLVEVLMLVLVLVLDCRHSYISRCT